MSPAPTIIFPCSSLVYVIINSVEVQAYVDLEKGIEINDVITHQVNTGSLVMDQEGPPIPVEWQNITIFTLTWDGDSLDYQLVFGGYVQGVEDFEEDCVKKWRVEFADYTVMLDHRIIKEQFDNKTDAEILAYLFAKYLPEFNATDFVVNLRTHDRVRYNRITMREAIDKLSDLSGADWYIENWYLHFFEGEEASAPFSLSNNPDLVSSFPFSNLVLREQGEGIINRVEVVGGYYLSEDATFYLAGTGQDNRVVLPFRVQAPVGETAIQVWRNDGTEAVPSWTAMTVKVGYIDSLAGADEVLYYFQEKVLEQQAVWPGLPNAVKVTARYEVPLRVRVTDSISYSIYGGWFDGKIIDANIVTREEAKLAGKTLLAREALAKVVVSVSVQKTGLRSGQLLNIVASNRGVDAGYLIQKVTFHIGMGGFISCDLELGEYNPDLIDLMLKLSRASESEAEWRDDEVLDELLESFESLPLAEAVDSSVSVGPYKWSPSSNDLVWSFGRWS